ncbi:MAG: agmatinase [Bdellovibrionales bacterium]|nr:agmatinase [Bdellovibrionales bacterium]
MSSHSNVFLGLPPELTNPETAKVALIQAPLENTTSFQHGTALGPAAFIEASTQVELYDIESGLEFCDVGAVTFDSPNIKGLKSEKALEIIQADVKRALDMKLWPMTIGGEHTISVAPLREIKKLYPDVTVLQIDAHADLRETYEGSPFSHACAMKRLWDMGIPVVGVGIRNYCKEEAAWVKEHKPTLFHAHEIHRQGLDPKKVSAALGKNVYITVDIDGFDPSEVPGTGTPEPGGIFWWQAIDMFRHIFKHHNVVGVDINEIMPIKSSSRTEFFAAKLAYQMIGMKFFTDQVCKNA